MEKARSHQSVNWYDYFKSIRKECPWSYQAYIHGKIDIVEYEGLSIPLGEYSARMYLVNQSNEVVEALAASHNHGEDEWLFSYPGYGDYATPVSVLIQQNRKTLTDLRQQTQ